MFDLNGKHALVTGGASGIGAAICDAFADCGAKVRVVDRDGEGAAVKAEEIVARGGRAESHQLDVADEAGCRQLAEVTGPLDVLVNNAGVGTVGTILQTEGSELDRLYQVNVRGMFNVTKAYLPGMIEREAGNIINMASICGIMAVRDRLAYNTTKFAVVGFTKSIALDHYEARIRANCICPARVETPWVKARVAEYPDPEKAYAEMQATQWFGRMVMPEEVAAAAVYLASDESFMVTGTEFKLDCGWTAGK